ncbi:MAG: GNAT family N-acetyltransferase [Chloroflexi bacterium]|nr:GNAT family N-acetyltransferase [Chloroflexota bacterium]
MSNDLRIASIETIADFERCVDIQRRTWGMADESLVPAHVLITVADIGGLALGAWLGEEMVGFVFGFAGRRADGRPFHHSHMAAVVPEHQGRGIGFALKAAQARAVAAQGVDLITWTYDPLETRNGHFNLNRLGAIARIYHRNRYGTMTDALNRGLESDRVEVEQWLNSARVQERLRGREAPCPPRDAIRVLAIWQDDLPHPPDSPPEPITASALIEVPPDFQALKAKDQALARAWRYYFRAVCERAFAASYALTALHREPGPVRVYYLLERSEL